LDNVQSCTCRRIALYRGFRLGAVPKILKIFPKIRGFSEKTKTVEHFQFFCTEKSEIKFKMDKNWPFKMVKNHR